MMGKWDYPQKKKSHFLQTLLRGFRAIGICLLCLAGVTALAMGAVIAFMDACGVWSFEWWHLIYWVTELFAWAYLFGKMCDDD